MFTSRELRRIARDKLSGHWGIAILVSIVAVILNGNGGFEPNASLLFQLGDADFYSLRSAQVILPFLIALLTQTTIMSGLLGLALFVIGSAVDLGRRNFYLGLCADENASFETLFSRFDILLKALGLRFYMALFILLWSLLFVIPGIVAAYRYAMAPYLMAQNPGMGIAEAVDKSKALMAGHKGRLFLLHLSFIGWTILSCLSFGIGFIWLTPYIAAADAAFYLERSGQGIPIREN